MTNTTKHLMPAPVELTFESGVLTDNQGGPRKISLRISLPDVGNIGVALTGDDILKLLTGATFTVPASLRKRV